MTDRRKLEIEHEAAQREVRALSGECGALEEAVDAKRRELHLADDKLEKLEIRLNVLAAFGGDDEETDDVPVGGRRLRLADP